MITGLLAFSLGIVLTLKANIGYAPWDVFHAGFANKTGLSFGIAAIIIGLVILIIVTLLGEKLGLGTILNTVLIGLIVDFIFPYIPEMDNLAAGIIMLVAGHFTVSIGTYFYIKSAFGVGPRDNLMVVLTRKTKLPVGLCRFIIELLTTGFGWVLGGPVGIGTVISVFAIGFWIQIVFKLFKFDVTCVKHETLKDTFMTIKGLKNG